MLFRVLDIETVPDLSIWKPGAPKWSPRPDLPRTHEVGATAWFEEVSGNYPMNVLRDLLYVKEEPFPPPHAHRVVAISWADVEMSVGDGPDHVKVYSLVDHCARASWSKPDSEVGLLSEFRSAMVGCTATIVTWNGRTFDLPVLAMRALHHGVPWGWYYDSRDIRYRYSAEGHLDLMDFLSDYGASRPAKLGDVARLVGLPGKTDMDGSMVAGIVAGDPGGVEEASVSRYCLQDVLQTALLFVRSRYHLEIITAVGYARSVETFKAAATGVVDVDWDKFSSLGGAGK
jgi:predicted PolB exonuclease-like 3'-5' exonuclease